MRTSLLLSGSIALGFMAISPVAVASCSSGYCNSGTSYSSSSSYSSYSNYGSTSLSAPCPAGSTRASDGLCMSNRSSSYSFSGTTGYTSAGTSYVSPPKIVPFTTSVSKISNYRVPGMGANEYLSPTECPVSVYNPDGGKVLGCYSVVKPKPIVRTHINYDTVRVVRPVVYVRYPVPVAVPFVRPSCGVVTHYSRYGKYWPRGGFGYGFGGRCGG